MMNAQLCYFSKKSYTLPLLKTLTFEELCPETLQQDGDDHAYSLGQQLLKRFQLVGSYAYQWQIPSIRELSLGFDCSTIDVLQAFQTLRRHGYGYALKGFDLPVIWEKQGDLTS